MRPIKLALFLVALATTALATSAAHADGTGVVVTGDATLQAPLAATLEGWLRDHGRELVASPLEPDAINRLADCFVIEDEGCAKELIDKRASAPNVIYAKVAVAPNTKDGTRDVTLTAYWFSKGHDPLADRRFCERCSDQSFKATADDLLAALAAAAQHDTGRLHLTSSPPAARVVVDGKVVGVTPIDLDLAPGDHTVALSADQHRVESRKVTIRRGETAPLDVPLVPGSSDGDDAGGGHGLLPKVLLGAGALGVVAGGVMIAKGSDDGPDTKYRYPNAKPIGIGVAACGIAAIGTGVYLWLHGGKAESAPTVAITSSGGFFGWAGSF
jgi:hypothetical protein